MKVALFGGTGFVGGYLVDELIARGHKPRMLVRAGSEDRIQRRAECETVSGDISDETAVRETLSGADAAIYSIGLLREFPTRGITFERMHFDGAKRCVDLSAEARVKRFVLMSANGVKADGTPYQRTKFAADQYLQNSELDWTIFRPSVLFGDPRGRMEFASQLYRDLVSKPLPAPLFYPGLLPFGAGLFEMSPVHVRDVAKMFAQSLDRTDSIGKIHCIGGPATHSWKSILRIIAEATGRSNITLPAPAWAVKAVAGAMQRFAAFPITPDQLTMLMEGNCCDAAELFRDYDIDPVPFDASHLDYLLRKSASEAVVAGHTHAPR